MGARGLKNPNWFSLRISDKLVIVLGGQVYESSQISREIRMCLLSAGDGITASGFFISTRINDNTFPVC